MIFRVWFAVFFAVVALVTYVLYGLIVAWPHHATQNHWLPELIGVNAFLWGGLKGFIITDPEKTQSLLEASIRSFLLLCGIVCTSIISSYLVAGLVDMTTRDFVGGLLTILMAIPYGPWMGILACVFSCWLLLPVGISAAIIVRACKKK